MDEFAPHSLAMAPMVRVSTLPTRLLALRHNPNVRVYSPEIIAQKIISCTRVEHKHTGTWRYISPRGELVFETHPMEKHRLWFQIGVAEPSLAIQAALKM